MKMLLWLPCFAAALYGKAQIPDSLFLRENNAPLSVTSLANPLFDTAFYNSRYILFGENHGMAEPQALDLALLKHLHQTTGLTKYIAEVDDSKAWLLNRYLQSGDEVLLQKVFRSWVADTAQWANQEHYQKFVQLHRYQQSLPAKKRITVVGIDLPQDYDLLHEHFAALTNGVRFEKHGAAFDSLLALTTGKPVRKAVAAAATAFYARVQNDRAFFQSRLKKRFAAFSHLVQSLSFLAANRDRVMYENLAALVERNGWQREKMYGFLGLYHCLQTGYSGNVPFAAHLKKALPAGERISSLVMYVLDSETLLPYVAQLRQMMPAAQAEKMIRAKPGFATDGRYIPFAMSNDNALLQVSGIAPLRRLSKPSSVHLFRVSGTNSPYAKTKALGEVTGFQNLKMNEAAAVTTDAFQYVLLFRNNWPATPL